MFVVKMDKPLVLAPALGRRFPMGSSFSPGSRIFRIVLLFIVVAVALGAAPVWAQSAADKATARELASAGIRQLQAGDAASAVESLERAQALYDAPVHLLYLGRAYEELGLLVESAEAYRSLARARLSDDAPPVFIQAQRDGERELKTVEPRIGRLNIAVEPSGIRDLAVTVDGEAMNTAALSVARPTNPGERVVRAEAPGYEAVEHTVVVKEGAGSEVKLRLLPTGELQVDEKGAVVPHESEPETASEFKTGDFGMMAGMRFGGVLPAGSVERGSNLSEHFAPGGSGRLELGFRFLKYVAAKLYGGGALFGLGTAHEPYARSLHESMAGRSILYQKELGAALMVTSDPRQLGAFAEVGWTFLQQYSWKQRVSSRGEAVCQNKAEYAGMAGRVGAGLHLPLHEMLTLVPTADLTFGQFRTRSYSQGCPVGDEDAIVWPQPIEQDGPLRKAMHLQAFFGLGVDLHFGDDLFR